MAFDTMSKCFQYTVREGQQWLVCSRESAEKCANNSAASRDCGCPWEHALTTLGKV